MGANELKKKKKKAQPEEEEDSDEADERIRMKVKKDAQREEHDGNEAYSRMDYKAAVQHYSRCRLMDSSRDKYILLNLVIASFKIERYKPCVLYCNELIRDCKDRIKQQALFWKGLALANLATCANHYKEAIAVLEQSRHKKAKDRLDIMKITTKMLVKQEQAAKPYQDKGLKLVYKGHYKRAEMQYTKAAKKNPGDPANFSDRAHCRINQDKLFEALEDAEQCIKLDPNLFAGYMFKAMVQLRLGIRGDALDTIAEGLEFNLGDPDIPGAIACIAGYEKASNSDASAEILKKVEELTSQHHQLNKELKSAKEHNENLKRLVAECTASCEGLRPYFICPISLGVMKNPVIAADGYAYEANIIAEWFAFRKREGKSVISPMTRSELRHDKLIPDLGLRSVIQKWRELRNKHREMMT